MSDKDDTDEDEGQPEAVEEEGDSGGKKKLILMVAALLLVIVAGVGGAFFMGVFGGEEKVEEVVVIPPGPPVYYEFPQMVLDLKKTGSRVNYIKIKVVAEIVSRDLPLLKAAELKITDKIQSYLRGQTRKDLAGAEGTEKMRADIQNIIDFIMAPVIIEGVLFREILLQ